MKIALGCDHAGFEVKNEVLDFLSDKVNLEIVDLGTSSLDSVDYPEYGHLVGEFVSKHQNSRGIVICGSGIGISIAANKIKGVRAALCFTKDHAEMSRLHNNSNILALGARMKGGDKLLDIVDIWLNTEFEGGRHQKRIEKIEKT